jgi:hypothetical protein
MKVRSADLVHVCDHSNSSYLRWTGKTPQVITAHDLLAVRSALGHFRKTRRGVQGKYATVDFGGFGFGVPHHQRVRKNERGFGSFTVFETRR